MEKQKLPNAIAVLVLGILSIPGCCFYAVGLVFGIIALVLAKKDTALYNSNPDGYDGYSNIKTGKILAIIGIVLSAIYLIFLIFIFATIGAAAFEDPALLQEKIRQMFGQ
jgi:M penetrans paralogue family 26